jgi:hypothetical protein
MAGCENLSITTRFGATELRGAPLQSTPEKEWTEARIAVNDQISRQR